MTDTKEKILRTALELFAEHGYEAVSVSMIAGKLGITKGALYKHYQSKRDIFDQIVARMYQMDGEQSQSHEVPEDTYEASPDSYRNLSPEHIRAFTLDQFRFWTEDPFAANFRRMLSLEQYRDREMGELYRRSMVSGPVEYMEDIFREMRKEGTLSEGNPGQLALEYYAPMYLLICMAEGTEDAEERARFAEMLDAHIQGFFEQKGKRK